MVFRFEGSRCFEVSGSGFRFWALGCWFQPFFEGQEGEIAKKKSHWVKPHLFKGRAPKKPKCHKEHNLGRFSTTKMLNQKKVWAKKSQNVIRSKTVFVRKLPAPCKFQRRTVDICSPRPGGAIRGVKETRVVSMVTSCAPRNKVHPSATNSSLRRRR